MGRLNPVGAPLTEGSADRDRWVWDRNREPVLDFNREPVLDYNREPVLDYNREPVLDYWFVQRVLAFKTKSKNNKATPQSCGSEKYILRIRAQHFAKTDPENIMKQKLQTNNIFVCVKNRYRFLQNLFEIFEIITLHSQMFSVSLFISFTLR